MTQRVSENSQNLAINRTVLLRYFYNKKAINVLVQLIYIHVFSMLKISINKVLLDRWPKQHEHEVILSSVSKCCADVLTALNQN